ncbi:hypothetical protein, partial [Klebsiella quasipneumoniae]|uniref:hypothetical protein n=1 Tax=Klebsiella quasipneumoniae TaxID=1463165 RepID=UPI00275591CF|nr:hypothetical protein [Klebsiella quasipneumoniae]
GCGADLYGALTVAGAVFPWRSANRFELLIDGPSFFPQMLVDIARAERQVELELYLVEAGACAEHQRRVALAVAPAANGIEQEVVGLLLGGE